MNDLEPEPSGWDDHLETIEAEKLLETGLSEEELDEHNQVAATWLRGQMVYAMARIVWATLKEYNLTLGVQSADWLHAGKEAQTMLVAITNGIIKQQLQSPRQVHDFTVRYLRSAGHEEHPDMVPWPELSEDQARKPMLVFSVPIALLADPQGFGW